MRKRKRLEDDHDHLDRWLISYSDFLTLMFTFFAALYALSTVDKEKVGQFSTSLRQAFNVIEKPVAGVEDGKKPILDEIRKSLGNIEGVSVKSDPRGLVVTLSNDTAFSSGSAEINEKIATALSSLAGILNKNPGRIVIEGHTDDVPASGPKYKSNWELSTARASSVLSSLIGQGIDPNRFIVAGYGEYRPLVSNSTEDGRAKNRRVEIVFAPSSLR
ncbi:MAG TPA: OmpA family protein [Dissulfurispiraceae bacterium]|nr:OmpA family protein [Dissulfurispiraceae bacterium]